MGGISVRLHESDEYMKNCRKKEKKQNILQLQLKPKIAQIVNNWCSKELGIRNYDKSLAIFESFLASFLGIVVNVRPYLKRMKANKNF